MWSSSSSRSDREPVSNSRVGRSRLSAITEGVAGARTGVEAVVDKDYVAALLVIAGTTMTSWPDTEQVGSNGGIGKH
jgi:hypothetical protein